MTFTTAILRIALLAGAVISPSGASAHVKWFCSTVDVTTPPFPIVGVLTPVFFASCLGFAILVFAGFMLDGGIARRWPALASSGSFHVHAEETLVRLATGVYFLLLWGSAATVAWKEGGSILTPELRAQAGWMGPVQLAVSILVIWRRSCILAAVGIGILYAYGVHRYGLFHMADYTFFPGIAAYLLLTTIGAPTALRLRVPLLSGGLAFGLMWTAIEKFAHPQWTLSVVSDHPVLAFGFEPQFVVMIAGLVEFSLAFYIMFGRGLMRFGAAGFIAVFVAAIPEFGRLDAVGHVPIIGVLAAVLLHGASPLQRTLGILERGVYSNAAAISAIYLLSLTGFFAMYYGLHWAKYG